MQITSEPETRTVEYRYLDIIFPTKTVSYTLTPADHMEREEQSLRITFANGTEVEVFLHNALSLETSKAIREEIVKATPH